MLGSTNFGGPYYPIDNVYYPATTHSVPLSFAPPGAQFYYVTTASQCLETLTSDTISPISFSVNSSDVACWDDTDGTVSVYIDDYINVLQYNFLLNGVLNTNAFPLDTVFYDLPNHYIY